jgi:hypothetical protein
MTATLSGAAASSDTAPINHVESAMPAHLDKQRRYDRGIRVWGAHGQEALERARVCLLTAGPTGAEALKNLVLGGIHSFTIVDGERVAPSDLGNNYLVTAAALGGSRAQCVTGARGRQLASGGSLRDGCARDDEDRSGEPPPAPPSPPPGRQAAAAPPPPAANLKRPRDAAHQRLPCPLSHLDPALAECLKELNETVGASYVDEDPAALIAATPAFFAAFDLVLGTQLRHADAVALDALCRDQGVRLLLARAHGLVGYVRVRRAAARSLPLALFRAILPGSRWVLRPSAPPALMNARALMTAALPPFFCAQSCVGEHLVVESRPDSEADDLRVGAPWAGLEAAAEEVDLGALTDAEYGHVPYGEVAHAQRSAVGRFQGVAARERPSEIRGWCGGVRATASRQPLIFFFFISPPSLSVFFACAGRAAAGEGGAAVALRARRRAARHVGRPRRVQGAAAVVGAHRGRGAADGGERGRGGGQRPQGLGAARRT